MVHYVRIVDEMLIIILIMWFFRGKIKILKKNEELSNILNFLLEVCLFNYKMYTFS